MIYNHYEQSLLEFSEAPAKPIVIKPFENMKEVLIIQKVVTNFIDNITTQGAIELLHEQQLKNSWRVGMIDYDVNCPLQYQIMDNQVLDAYVIDNLVVMDVISLSLMDSKTIKLLHRYKRYHSFYLCPNAFCHDETKTFKEHLIEKKLAYYPLTIIEQNKRLTWGEKTWRYDIDLSLFYKRFIKDKNSYFR